jgi:hypothetical protein
LAPGTEYGLRCECRKAITSSPQAVNGKKSWDNRAGEKELGKKRWRIVESLNPGGPPTKAAI